MATVKGIQTVNGIYVMNILSDPSAGGGTVAPIGSFGGVNDGSGLWYKAGVGNADWVKAATLTSGVLSPDQGGTGINNSSNTLTLSGVTSITGGGTIALGGFTATISQTGTIPISSSTATNRVAFYSGTNALTGSSGLTFSSSAFVNSLAVAGTVSISASNNNTGTASLALVSASNGTTTTSLRHYGTGFTTSGLLQADLGVFISTSPVGVLFANSMSSTKMWWAIGGVGTANEVLSLTTTEFTFSDSLNIVLNATTGTKIGTATSQKIGLWNATPIIQPASANQAALINSTGGTYNGTLVDVATAGIADPTKINDNFTDIHTLLNEIRTAMVNFGSMKGAA